MREYLDFYIDGRWVAPVHPKRLDVIDPSTEQAVGCISLGSAEDVDLAVKAAQRAFATFGRSSRKERLELLQSIISEYRKREKDLADAVREEMGAPAWLASGAHVPFALAHFETALKLLPDFEYDEKMGSTLVTKEPIGVVGMITPWNWPINQIACKVAPAIAVGCTMVLKPSEVAPFSGQIFTEVMHSAGTPAGVFNMVQGDGPTVGAAISSHPGVDMVSFTGSTRGGIDVARNAAATVKRVHQELGGKSANIILEDADIDSAVSQGVAAMMVNSGQSCNAPTRMLVPAAKMERAKEVASETIAQQKVGPPTEEVNLGPVVSDVQWNRIQTLIEKGIAEGADLVAGGPGKPEGLNQGYYVRPTVFADVNNQMTIAREEIFGPVLVMIPYEDEEQAIEIANDTVYGLAGYVQSGDLAHAREVASRIRAGQVCINYAPLDMNAPFGGYKQSGNGREWGEHAFHEFLEAKAVMGYAEA